MRHAQGIMATVQLGSAVSQAASHVIQFAKAQKRVLLTSVQMNSNGAFSPAGVAQLKKNNPHLH